MKVGLDGLDGPTYSWQGVQLRESVLQRKFTTEVEGQTVSNERRPA